MMLLLAIAAVGLFVWYGRQMHESGRELGRLEARWDAEQAERARVQQAQEAALRAWQQRHAPRPRLRVVK